MPTKPTQFENTLDALLSMDPARYGQLLLDLKAQGYQTPDVYPMDPALVEAHLPEINDDPSYQTNYLRRSGSLITDPNVVLHGFQVREDRMIPQFMVYADGDPSMDLEYGFYRMFELTIGNQNRVLKEKSGQMYIVYTLRDPAAVLKAFPRHRHLVAWVSPEGQYKIMGAGAPLTDEQYRTWVAQSYLPGLLRFQDARFRQSAILREGAIRERTRQFLEQRTGSTIEKLKAEFLAAV